MPIDWGLVISDIARDGDPGQGVAALPAIRAVAPDMPVLFYIARLTSSVRPVGAQGITNEPNELLHLIMDRLERALL